MNLVEQKVRVSDVKIGMYVSRLDRPWLETPFLFQGFVIRTAREIEELRRYCSHVYIDSEKSSLDVAKLNSPAREKEASESRGTAKTGSWTTRILRKFISIDAREETEGPGSYYKDTQSLQKQWAPATEIHPSSSTRYPDVVEKLRTGGTLDAEVLDTVVSPMVDSILRNRDALIWVSRLDSVDEYTYSHSVSCAAYAIAFGRHLGLPRDDLQVLGLGGLLLDIGKTRLPKEILERDTTLSEAEIQQMREHVRIGVELLKKHGSTIDPRIVAMVEAHHERYDGSGYPRGISGPDIPVFARIAGVIDVYDAVVSQRPYRGPISSYDAVRLLHAGAGKSFQEEMVEQFVQAIGMFPNGALVELSTGEVGIVIEQNRVRRLRPRVVVILDENKTVLAKPQTIDLRKRPAEPGSKRAIWIQTGL